MITSHPLFALLLSGGLGLLLTPAIIFLSRRMGIVDLPNPRKVHTIPVPRLGGLAIAAATLISAFVSIALVRPSLLGDSDIASFYTLLVGAICICAIGLLDDLWEISSKVKLGALLIAALAFCASGALIHSVIIGGHRYLDLGQAAWPVTLLWIVLVTVSVNFIDGLDGLAAGIVSLAAIVLAVGAADGGDAIAMLLALSLAGALLGFLSFNIYPAKVFMGDCGSMFIGFLLAGTCVLTSEKIGSTRSVMLPALTLVIPLFDTFFTMVRRGVLQRRSLFAAERGHIHHRLLDVGLCHRHVVWLLHLITIAAALVSIICVFGGRWASLVASLILCSGLVLLFKAAGTVRAKETFSAIRRNRAIGREARQYQSAFYDLQLGFREARTFDSWWDQVCRTAHALNFAKLDLPLVRRDGQPHLLRWRRDGELLAATTSIIAEVPIRQRRNCVSARAQLEVLTSEFLENGGQRIALFSRLMSEFGLDRLPPDHRRDVRSEGSIEPPAKPKNPGPFPFLKVALVHDFLYTYAGAERVLEQLVDLFPHADLFSLFDFLPQHQRAFIHNKVVSPSFLQRLPFARRRHRAYLPLMPLAIEQLDVSKYDLVISSSYLVAKGILTRPDQLHICYCHTPVRFAWDMQQQYLGQTNLARGIKSFIAKCVLHYIRNWDVRSANGVDVFLTNSDYVGRRIEKIYRRSSTTIYPPVDIDQYSLHEHKEDFYLTVSRMVPYKRIDLIVEAFSRMPNRRLLVVGDGPDMELLRAKAGANVTLLGHESPQRLRRHMQLARAFIFAAEEDFGIAPVEAQACGTPVIAFARGGAAETIVHGRTGMLFSEQTSDAIVRAVEDFETRQWDPFEIRRNAERFSTHQFRESVVRFVKREWASFTSRRMRGLQNPEFAPQSFAHAPGEKHHRHQNPDDAGMDRPDEIQPLQVGQS